jgi:hypothetical protein
MEKAGIGAPERVPRDTLLDLEILDDWLGVIGHDRLLALARCCDLNQAFQPILMGVQQRIGFHVGHMPGRPTNLRLLGQHANTTARQILDEPSMKGRC